MSESRLSALDAAFLDLESSSAPMHVGWAAAFNVPTDGKRPSFEAIRAHIQTRLGRAPRYRQRLVEVPLGVGDPVWVDDDMFDVARHVRRAAAHNLGELADEVMSQPLASDRPLWELWIAERLQDGKIGVVGKAHHCLVDGLAAVELMALLLDPTPEPERNAAEKWKPTARPSAAALIGDALRERTGQSLGLARLPLGWVRAPRRVLDLPAQSWGVARTMAHTTVPLARSSRLNGAMPSTRHLAYCSRPLENLKVIKRHFGTTINDVVLAASASAIRELLLEHGERPRGLKAMVPVSVRAEEERWGNRIAFLFVGLPCEEPDAVVRLRLAHEEMRQRKQGREPQTADAMLGAVSRAPAPVRRLVSRALASPRLSNLTISNIPGPTVPLYLMGCEAERAYPIVPLTSGHGVSIGMTTVNRQACFGIYAQAGLSAEADRLARGVEQAIDELLARCRHTETPPERPGPDAVLEDTPSVIGVDGRLGFAQCHALERRVQTAIKAGERHLIVDLRAVSGIVVAPAVAALARADRLTRAADGTVRVLAGPGRMHDAFRAAIRARGIDVAKTPGATRSAAGGGVCDEQRLLNQAVSPDAVLLTGATGFVGMELLARYLQRTDRTVYALIRADDNEHAERRLGKTLVELFGHAEVYRDRVVALAGDITQRRLGLDATQTETVAAAVDEIVHSAGSVSFDLDLEQTRRINLDGTRRLLRFAKLCQRAGGLRRFSYISTAYVAGDHKGCFAEDDLDVGQRFRNPYEQSKYEAEQLIGEHRARLPITVVRPSIIVGDRHTGWTASFNVLYWPLRAFSRGLYPALPARPDAPLDVVSVDYVADAVLALARDPGAEGLTYHLTASEHASSIGELLALACARFNREAPPFISPELYRHAIHPLLLHLKPRARGFLRATESYLPYFAVKVNYDNTHAYAALAPEGISPAPLPEYFNRLIDYALLTRWGHRPLTRADATSHSSEPAS